MDGSQVSNVPHTFASWGGKACVPYLSWVSAPSGPTSMEEGTSGVLRAPNCCIGRRVGTWSPSWARTLEPVTGLGRASLVYAFGFRHVFRVPS